MRIRRLGWAGLELEAEGATLLVDPLDTMAGMEQFIGEARTALPPHEADGSAAGVLVTHLHIDHADPAAIARALAPDGVVLRPTPSTGGDLEAAGVAMRERELAEPSLAARVVEPWETVEIGPFTVTALPAADGLGDPQVSWAIAAGDRRIAHFGDTTFHGWWWSIAMRHGPFDAAFLPINGPVCDFPHRQPPSPLPAAMDPRQAAVAAHLLGVTEAVPIHYDTVHLPPFYAQVDDPVGKFLAECERLDVNARVVEPGKVYELAERVA